MTIFINKKLKGFNIYLLFCCEKAILGYYASLLYYKMYDVVIKLLCETLI